MPRYALGLDFGTESARALLVNMDTGEEAAEEVCQFAHGVITDKLPIPGGVKLGHDWALQDPADYLTAIEKTVPASIKSAGARPEEVVGIGVDFTACTLAPCRSDGAALATLDEYRDNPHAWVKLWKHHGAAQEAEEVTSLAKRRGEAFLDYFGGAVSSEWLLPKAMETARQAPEVYAAAAQFVEAGDWIVWQLTGVLCRNSTAVGYKGMHVDGLGYPSHEFLGELDPKVERLYSNKIQGPVMAPGDKVGTLTKEMADKLGLAAGTAVSAATIDAHAGVPGCGVTAPGKMVAILGTSFCHMLLHDKPVLFDGFAGLVKDGILKGYYGYESGQTGGGDIYSWFLDNCVPGRYALNAETAGLSLHDYLAQKAQALRPGGSGVVALDWWNGNRSILMDAKLSGLWLGMTLSTRPEELYLSLLEATVFGTRRIIESYEHAGIPIKELHACGGLPHKNPMLMQLFADICNRDIVIAASAQTVALGAAMFGSLAAGSAAGGFDTIEEGASSMVRPSPQTYRPNAAAATAYDSVYAEYLSLHDHFGREEKMMHRLKALRSG